VQGEALTAGVRLYSRDEDLRVEYEVYARKRYYGFQPILKMMREAYLADLEAGLKEQGLYGGSTKV
jgi:hypothetical protein